MISGLLSGLCGSETLTSTHGRDAAIGVMLEPVDARSQNRGCFIVTNLPNINQEFVSEAALARVETDRGGIPALDDGNQNAAGSEYHAYVHTL